MSSPYDSVRYASLYGRNVLITGGASGIGEEMVKAFAEQGGRVSFIDIDAETGARTAAATGTDFLSCDITNIDRLRSAISAVEDKHGAIDVLINNAGKDDRHPIGEVEPDYWRRALALNLDHQFFATQAASRRMAEQARGSVIMLGSISWMRGRPGMVGYTTAKAAINGMTRTLARELGPSGIRVNCIVPGAIVTERQLKLWTSPEQNQQFIDLQALKFRLDATHVARMALFLGSDESDGCTGANFVVDAGLTQN
ncbi:SDR family NAD(P)-dependent oxidoreductase [Rhizobium sp. BK176]|uniref:SDR family NAD(P)-dependent oxidoreductase n=1 Tax=Rhizobium sp. BK176 TaxID=2587071 RepID=UPI002168CCE9|nr:SDR family oxidoreductase [Rhizobium sp. BK176]MCS4093979.1 NAD(P)-dependent dehydrogenase (short-subunit alcohol dehydrogenase family) [Rhizobium sp. BK176]